MLRKNCEFVALALIVVASLSCGEVLAAGDPFDSFVSKTESLTDAGIKIGMAIGGLIMVGLCIASMFGRAPWKWAGYAAGGTVGLTVVDQMMIFLQS